MCFNSTISIISYIIGFSSSLLLYKRGYQIEGVFYGWVVQMQLIEYLLWINNKKTTINKNLTKLGIAFTHLQPYILYLAINHFNKNKLPLYVHQLMFIFLILNLIYFNVNSKLLNLNTIGIPNKLELQWKIQYGKYKRFYLIFLSLLLILTINGLNKYNYLNAVLIFITYIGSYIKYDKTKGVGSVWCVFAAYVPFLLNIIYYINDNNDNNNNEKNKSLLFFGR